MYSLALFCSGSFHLIKHFYPHPAYFHVPPPAARWKPQQTRSGGTVLDTKQKESPHKRKNHMSLWELVIMPKIGWTESYSVGLKCLVHWKKRLSTPRIQLSVDPLQKDFTERYFFCFGWPTTLYQQLPSHTCWSAARVWDKHPTLALFQPVRGWAETASYKVVECWIICQSGHP